MSNPQQIKDLNDSITQYNNTQSLIGDTYKNQISRISSLNYRDYDQKNDPKIDSSPDIMETNPRDIQMKKTTNEVKNEDIQQLILQENALYSIGIITCATLLIAGILVSKSVEA